MHQKRAPVNCRPASACCHSCEVREDICAAAIRSQHKSVETRSPSQPQCGGTFRLTWWVEFLDRWNSISLLATLGRLSPTVTLTSNASGKWGCGAFWEQGWFQLAWADTTCRKDSNIATKELIPIMMAAAMWGSQWQGQAITCRCDNAAVV